MKVYKVGMVIIMPHPASLDYFKQSIEWIINEFNSYHLATIERRNMHYLCIQFLLHTH